MCVAVASNLEFELLKTGIEPSTLLSPLNSKPEAAGPQGPGFDLTLDHSAKVDNSVMYYQQSSGKVILDNNVTTLKLVDGGNF